MAKAIATQSSAVSSMTNTRSNSVGKTSYAPAVHSDDWPEKGDYVNALQNPQNCFEDRGLKESAVECRRQLIKGKE